MCSPVVLSHAGLSQAVGRSAGVKSSLGSDGVKLPVIPSQPVLGAVEIREFVMVRNVLFQGEY